MGLGVYVENQVHERRYAGGEASSSLQRLVAASDRELHHLVSMIDSYGDTMINLIQLPQLTAELDEIASRNPELRVDVQVLEALIEEATRARGYLWISGDWVGPAADGALLLPAGIAVRHSRGAPGSGRH